MEYKKLSVVGDGNTIDDDGGSGASSLGYDVLGHAGVVGRVRQPSLLDDQVVVDGDVEVTVVRRVDNLLILQPLNLCEKETR